MSTFTVKQTVTVAPTPGASPSWIAVGAGTANAIAFRIEDVGAVDVRGVSPDRWRATIYVKGVSTVFNIDGDLEATRKLLLLLQVPMQIEHITEEKL